MSKPKAGKWKTVTDVLPRYIEEPARQDKVEAVKTEILNTPELDATSEKEAFAEIERNTNDALMSLMSINLMLKSLNAGRRHASVYARLWAEYRQIRDAIEDQMKQLSLTGEAYAQLIDAQYEAEGITNLKIEDLGSVRVQVEPWAMEEDPVAFRTWCRQNGLENEMSLAWQKRTNLVKDFLEKGMNPPPGIKVWSKVKLFFTKG